MSRALKIAFILKSRYDLPVYKDLITLSDPELDEQVRALLALMHEDESAQIARMPVQGNGFGLN